MSGNEVDAMQPSQKAWPVIPVFVFFCHPCCRGGEAFAASCQKTGEPEDVTVGLVVGEWNTLVPVLVRSKFPFCSTCTIVQ